MNLNRLIGSFVAIISALAMTACAATGGVSLNISEGGARPLTGTCYIGPLIIDQTPAVDRITAGVHEDVALDRLWEANQNGEVPGAHAQVRTYIEDRTGREVWWTAAEAIDTYRYYAAPCSAITSGSALCMDIYGRSIAHQTLAPTPVSGVSRVCEGGFADGDSFYEYFHNGRGRNGPDAKGVGAVLRPL